jgi:hypothetical protein
MQTFLNIYAANGKKWGTKVAFMTMIEALRDAMDVKLAGDTKVLVFGQDI